MWHEPVQKGRTKADLGAIRMDRANQKWKTENRDQYRKFVQQSSPGPANQGQNFDQEGGDMGYIQVGTNEQTEREPSRQLHDRTSSAMQQQDNYGEQLNQDIPLQEHQQSSSMAPRGEEHSKGRKVQIAITESEMKNKTKARKQSRPMTAE